MATVEAITPPPSPPVSEEGPPRELTSEEIAQLKQRIEALEGQLERYEKARRKSAPKTPATEPHVGLLPLEFAAFGDIYYQILEPGADDFVVGNVELDPTFHLSDYVAVSAALAFSGANQNLSLAVFVVDCGLLGEGEGFPSQSSVVSRSGVSFGQFDVPFGVAYLEYPSVSNRLMRVPQAVSGTYASWNDVGVQGYAEAEHWTLITYVVNGSQFETDLADSSNPGSVRGDGAAHASPTRSNSAGPTSSCLASMIACILLVATPAWCWVDWMYGANTSSNTSASLVLRMTRTASTVEPS